MLHAWGVAKRVTVAAQELLSNAGSCFARRATAMELQRHGAAFPSMRHHAIRGKLCICVWRRNRHVLPLLYVPASVPTATLLHAN